MRARTLHESEDENFGALRGRELLLGQVARREGVHPSTVWRWCRRGIVVAGQRICLSYFRRGRAIFIDPGAVREWAAAVARAQQELVPVPPRTGPPAAGGREAVVASLESPRADRDGERRAKAAEARARKRLGMSSN